MNKILMTPKPTSVIGLKHHEAYKSFVENGNLTVTYDTNEQVKYFVSEKEPWDVFDKYFEKFNITTMPKYMCDKELHVEKFTDANINVLQTRLALTLDDFRTFTHGPIILKPKLSGGSEGIEIAYKIFNTSNEFVFEMRQFKNSHILPQVFDQKELVIQQSVAYPDQTYGQLYVEGFVNEKHEVFFSSIHEIEFMNGRWTKQLPWKLEDNEQVAEIKEKLTNLIKQNKIANTMFLLQFLRNYDDNIWYPTDWQYRLSYNSLWGRMHFEKEYCADCVKFMSNQIDKVSTTSNLKYYQSYVIVDISKTKNEVRDLMDKYKIVNIPFSKNTKDNANKFLFITGAKTFELAEEQMTRFAKEIVNAK